MKSIFTSYVLPGVGLALCSKEKSSRSVCSRLRRDGRWEVLVLRGHYIRDKWWDFELFDFDSARVLWIRRADSSEAALGTNHVLPPAPPPPDGILWVNRNHLLSRTPCHPHRKHIPEYVVLRDFNRHGFQRISCQSVKYNYTAYSHKWKSL